MIFNDKKKALKRLGGQDWRREKKKKKEPRVPTGKGKKKMGGFGHLGQKVRGKCSK